MSNPLEPHPFAALFPELPPEELTQLARDIKERGQLEPIMRTGVNRLGSGCWPFDFPSLHLLLDRSFR